MARFTGLCARRCARGWAGRWGALGLGASTLLSCAPEPFVHDDLEGRVIDTESLWYVAGAPALNLLLVVENSPRMEPLVEVLVEEVGRLLRALLGDLCTATDEGYWRLSEEEPDAWGYCQGDGAWARSPRIDLRVGILSTSLGGPGCSTFPPENDGARFMGQVRPELFSHHPAGFLSWDRETPREGVGEFVRAVEAHIRAVGHAGCEYPAPLEVLHRFLRTGEQGGEGLDWDDTQFLLQRGAFLRDGVPLMVVGALTQDDCSLPADLDIAGIEPELLDEPQSACERLIHAFPSDPRIPAEDYRGLRSGPFFPRSRDECSSSSCPVYSYGLNWALPWGLAEGNAWLRLQIDQYGWRDNVVELSRMHEFNWRVERRCSSQDLCLPQRLSLDEEGGVTCRVAAVQAGLDDSPPDCAAPGLRPVDETLRRLVDRRLRESGHCAQAGKPPCDALVACEVEQLRGEQRDGCLAEEPKVSGFCYTDTVPTSYVDAVPCTGGCPTPAALRVVSPRARPVLESRLVLLACRQERGSAPPRLTRAETSP